MGKFIVLGIFFLLLIGMVNVIAQIPNAEEDVITSYSIHYTKLYDVFRVFIEMSS